jgi:outer membrane protein assembly factor BamA
MAALGLVLTVALAAGQDSDLRIADVKVAGARRVPEQRVLNEVKVRKDQPYRQDVIREDVRKLDSTQWYYRVEAEEQRVPEGVVVVFRVIERSTIQEVIYEGTKHLSKKDLESITGLKKGMPMSVAMNKKAVQALRRKYDEIGRLFAEIELVEGGRDEDMRVVFRVTEGPQVQVRDIRFEGNQFVSDARLKTQIDSGESFMGMRGTGKYRPEMLGHDRLKLIEYYRSFGFFDVKIYREVRWNPGHEDVDVVFVVDEGVRYLMDGAEIAGNKRIDDAVLLAHNKLEEGKPFNGQVMQASARRMSDEYGRRGYVTSRVVPDMRFSEEPGSVNIVYQVVEGPPARVGEIYIVGNTVTRDNVIRRQLLVYPGQILSTPEMRASERNLARLNIFKVQPEQGIVPTISIIDPDVASEYKDLLVQVEEDRTGSIVFGAGINSDAGATASIVLNERNFDITRFPTSWDDIVSNRAFRGAGQEFRMEVVPGTELNRLVVSWREPYLFDSTYSLGASGYYYTRNYPDMYDEVRGGGRVSVGHRFSNLWTGNVSFRGENVKIFDFPFYAPEPYQEVGGSNTVLAPRAALSRDSRDSILRPTEGNLFETFLEWGFGSFNYPIVGLTDNQYFTVYERPDGSGRHVIALRGEVAFAGDDTPLFERFYAGGFRTLRGFEFRGVGPVEDGFRIGGMFMLLGSVEYQIPIMANDNLYAVVFSDFGTVETDVEIQNFRVSLGAGIRVVVPMFGPVPIALDLGFPIVKKDTDDTQLISFFVGFTR